MVIDCKKKKNIYINYERICTIYVSKAKTNYCSDPKRHILNNIYSIISPKKTNEHIAENDILLIYIMWFH